MTYTDPTPPTSATGATTTQYELCDHCQAPLAERQRYCVVCGSRRAHADDPAARYFIAATRRARASETPPPSASTSGSSSRLRYAIVLALLPLVAAIGVMVGGNNSDSQQLVDALKAQKAPVVNVVGGGTGTAATADADSSGGDDATDAKARRGVAKESSAANGEVIAKTRYGNARSLTDSRVTPEQIEESRRALEHIVESKGKEYVEQQRNLPDQIVIP